MNILDKKENKLVFSEDVDISLANAIRRSCLETPILAIEDVEFKKNDSALYDEVLALRLGLLPLIPGKKVKKDGKIKLKLKAKGPCTVYAKEIEGNVEVVYPEMPIVKLEEKQSLELSAEAVLGRGIEHTKFSPGLIYYSYKPEIEKIDKKQVKDRKVINVNEKEFKEIENKKERQYDFVGDVIKNKDSYLYIKKDKEIIFFVESWGQLKPKEIIEEAVNALKNNLKEVKKAK